jgi:molybdate transport system substrate-binding protein
VTSSRLSGVLLAASLLVSAGACGGDDGDEGDDGVNGSTDDDEPGGELGGEVVVFAAASLTDAFTELGEAFAEEHPGTSVTFSFAASSELAGQLIEGAPADVFASADGANMTKAVDADSIDGRPTTFATNRPTIVVTAGNPEGIETLADLTRPGRIVVVCAPEVPCGSYASQVFEAAGIEVTPDSYEENVRAVVTKVALGEADAGLAYETDAASDDRIDAVALPDEIDVVAEYPMAVVADAPNAEAGQAFVDFALGERGREILIDHGFGRP